MHLHVIFMSPVKQLKQVVVISSYGLSRNTSIAAEALRLVLRQAAKIRAIRQIVFATTSGEKGSCRLPQKPLACREFAKKLTRAKSRSSFTRMALIPKLGVNLAC
jgi:hypothetical protein